MVGINSRFPHSWEQVFKNLKSIPDLSRLSQLEKNAIKTLITYLKLPKVPPSWSPSDGTSHGQGTLDVVQTPARPQG